MIIYFMFNQYRQCKENELKKPLFAELLGLTLLACIIIKGDQPQAEPVYSDADQALREAEGLERHGLDFFLDEHPGGERPLVPAERDYSAPSHGLLRELRG